MDEKEVAGDPAIILFVADLAFVLLGDLQVGRLAFGWNSRLLVDGISRDGATRFSAELIDLVSGVEIFAGGVDIEKRRH